jgi:peptidoglycan/LPS O-acetylase OafA/YrhL
MSGQRSTARHAFLELDAMRGVAAICVMLYHYSEFLADRKVLPSAYLAVDLFFILSGFIIAHAYRARLQAGLSFARFTLIRLIRLYPLYLAGTALGLLYLLSRNVMEPWRVDSAHEWAGSVMLSVLFLPKLWPTAKIHGLYPFDPAAWSLLFEIIVNLAYGAVCIALTPRRLRWIIAIGVVGIVAAATHYGALDLGMTRRTLAGGLARVVLSFFAGVYLHHLYDKYNPSPDDTTAQRRLPPFTFEVMLIVLVLTFSVHVSGIARQIYDTLCVLLLFPALIWLGARLPSPRALRPLYAEAGRLSYGIYILHTPLLLIAAGAYKALRHADPQFARPYSGLVFVVLTLACTAVAVRQFDEPVRRRLNRIASNWRRAPAMALPPAVSPAPTVAPDWSRDRSA